MQITSRESLWALWKLVLGRAWWLSPAPTIFVCFPARGRSHCHARSSLEQSFVLSEEGFLGNGE